MSDVGLGLHYWLPQTQFTVNIARRNVVRTLHAQSTVVPVVDVQIVPAAIQDPTSRQTLRIDAGLFEKITLDITLDDRGFIQSINSEAGRDISSVISLVGKAVGLAGSIMILALMPIVEPRPKSLEEAWEEEHPSLVEHAAELEAKTHSLLQKIGDVHTSAEDVATNGVALGIVQDQLATISEAKRSWIAGHNATMDSHSARLKPSDLLPVNEPEFPSTLQPTTVPPAMEKMADKFGVLIAMIDRDRARPATPSEPELVDKIALRPSRGVTIGVYLRTKSGEWQIDAESINSIDIVDELSGISYISLNGPVWRTKAFELSYHPDMSLKSYGVKTDSSASAIATSVGEVFDALTAARKQLHERPTVAEEQLEKAKTQLELLKNASEYEVLAATRSRAAELAVLQQQEKMRDLRS